MSKSDQPCRSYGRKTDFVPFLSQAFRTVWHKKCVCFFNSKFVSERAGQMFPSILGWGKQLKSKFLMLYIVSIKATSPSTVSNWPICYSVTFWGSNEEVELYKKWLKIEVLQIIFLNLKSILTSRNLAAGFNLTSSPSYKDFKKCASINVTLYGFGIIQGFSAKKLFLWPNQLYLSGFM